jgi:hypothetical protein
MSILFYVIFTFKTCFKGLTAFVFNETKKTMKYEKKKKFHSDIEPDQSFTFKTCFKGLTAFVSN